MPSSNLYAINNEGRVFYLPTNDGTWKEFVYLGLEFKQLSAAPNFLWAIGGDHQMYVHVHGLDIPIRIKEEAYQNERWLPIEGFSDRLLPTDRFQYSNEDGTIDRHWKRVKLPSMAWQWEGDWQLETTLDGQPLDQDGWTYAIDFPAKYHPTKQWSSCVRRRKWIRYRYYSAMNLWCALPPLHKDPTKEPFIDVSIGGYQIPGGTAGDFVVWAVTANGRIMLRTEVSTTSPEGSKWNAIKLPSGCEVSQISVGATGLVWASLLNGKVIVRLGVTRDNPAGEEWIIVSSPHPDLKIIQVSVGLDSVWAITNDYRIWFRKGIKGEMSGMCEKMASGSGWIEISNKIASVSVAPNDQVWVIGKDDQLMYYRTEISPSELTGKNWKQIVAPYDFFSKPNSSTNSSNRPSICSTPQKSVKEATLLPRDQYLSPAEEQFESAISEISLKDSPATVSDNFAIKNADLIPENIDNEALQASSSSPSPMHSMKSQTKSESQSENLYDAFECNSRESSIYAEDDNVGAEHWVNSEMQWNKIGAGACLVDINNPPKWIGTDLNGSAQGDISECWRVHILEELKSRLKNIDIDLSTYEKAIERLSWIKNGQAKCKIKGSSTYEDCVIELEWINSESGSLDSGTFNVLAPDGATTLVQFPMSEIVCIHCCSEPGSPRLAIHVPRLTHSKIIRLQFKSDLELEDWTGYLTSVSCQINNAFGKPSPKSIWATTSLGDVFVCDIVLIEENQCENGIYVQDLCAQGKTLPLESILQNGFGPSHTLQISGYLHDDVNRVSINLVCASLDNNKIGKPDSRDIAFHFNPRLNENLIVRNTYINCEWGEEERSGGSPLRSGSDFNLLIKCEDRGFRVFINNVEFTFYRHRIHPQKIVYLQIKGKMTLCSVVYKSSSVIIEPVSIFWRQIGGHLKKVESSESGVTWGIGYDCMPWVYTGGWGGSFLKGMEFSESRLNTMMDTRKLYVYENQRWNPITGFTARGLPTDRCMWSDASGRHKRTKDNVKLLSVHWQWISDWMIDYQTPGGVDHNGWQYAPDFPFEYHPKKQFTDLVRRRRWFRKCQLKTCGPWKEIGNTKLADVSLRVSENPDTRNPIHVWAVSMSGEALFRCGVSEQCPVGTSWEHIPSNQSLSSISIGPKGQVWALGKNGSAYWRYGITVENPTGEAWQYIEPPVGSQLKQISVGNDVVWVLDTNGKLSVRREIQADVFQEGTCWQTLASVSNDPIHIDASVNESKQGFRHVSVSRIDSQVWAISGAGIVCRRIGVAAENPAGTSWVAGIAANWQHITTGGLFSNTN